MTSSLATYSPIKAPHIDSWLFILAGLLIRTCTEGSEPLPTPYLQRQCISWAGLCSPHSHSWILLRRLLPSHRFQRGVEEKSRVPRTVCEVWLQHILWDIQAHSTHVRYMCTHSRARAYHKVAICTKYTRSVCQQEPVEHLYAMLPLHASGNLYTAQWHLWYSMPL